MQTDLIKMDTVEEYNKLFGLETLHPLVNVIDLSEATRFPTRFTINYGIYALFLKETKCGDIRYGRQVIIKRGRLPVLHRGRCRKWKCRRA